MKCFKLLANIYIVRLNLQQQMHAQQALPHGHAPSLPLIPHPGLQPPSLPPGTAPGLLALTAALNPHLTALKHHNDEAKINGKDI